MYNEVLLFLEQVIVETEIFCQTHTMDDNFDTK